MPWARLLESQLAFIERVIGENCRRSSFDKETCEDFRGRVMVKLIQDDYAVFRLFKGKSKIETYLTTVISRQCSDFRDHLWGKWRPSRAAQRIGPVAVRLEQLVSRDGVRESEAIQVLLNDPLIELEEVQLDEILARLPKRNRRQFVEADHLENIHSKGPDPERQLLEKERREALSYRSLLLEKCLGALPQDEQLIFRLRMDGVKVSKISRMIGFPDKQLYRRIERSKSHLRKCMEDEGH